MKTVFRTLCIFLLLISVDVRAELKAYVDRNPVSVDETFTLTVESDAKTNERPDFSILESDFRVLNESSSSSVQFINGSVSRSVKWQVSLIAKRDGKIQVPAFNVDGETSQPFVMHVAPATTPQSGQVGEPLFMEAVVDVKAPYVQQQIILSVYFYRSVNITGSTLSDLNVSGVDAIVQQLGEDKEYRKNINGTPHVVFERKFVIYPQESGEMNIGQLTFDVGVVDPNNRRFDPFGRSAIRKQVHTKAITLEIKPIPSGMVGSWLPASEIKLGEDWSSDTFVVGEPVTRTIGLMAHGLTSAQLPEIIGNMPDDVKIYPDKAITKDSVEANGIVGARQQKIAIIPTKAGKIKLPAIHLPWWNTQTQKMEVAKLPARTITVEAAPKGATAQTPVMPAQLPTSSVEESAESAAPVNVQTITTVVNAGWWPWVSLALGIAWIITFIAWWRKGSAPAATKEKVQNIDLPAMRTIEGQLKNACQNNDATQAKQSLIHWAQQRWSQSAQTTPTSLTALARHSKEPLAKLLTELDAALYANKQSEWQGNALWQAFSQNKPAPEETGGAHDGDGLAPLY